MLDTKNNNGETMETVVYEALRSEIIQRLSFQQQIINFTLVLAGILMPVLFAEGKINNKYILAILLMGAFISCALAFISLKQHLIIAQLSEFISTKIDIEIFGEWEKYFFQNKLFGNTIPSHVYFFMGLFDVFFPFVVSGIYILTFFAFCKNIPQNVYQKCLLFGGLVITIVLLIYAGYWGRKIKNWIIEGRKTIDKTCLTNQSS